MIEGIKFFSAKTNRNRSIYKYIIRIITYALFYWLYRFIFLTAVFQWDRGILSVINEKNKEKEKKKITTVRKDEGKGIKKKKHYTQNYGIILA